MQGGGACRGLLSGPPRVSYKRRRVHGWRPSCTPAGHHLAAPCPGTTIPQVIHARDHAGPLPTGCQQV